MSNGLGQPNGAVHARFALRIQCSSEPTTHSQSIARAIELPARCSATNPPTRSFAATISPEPAHDWARDDVTVPWGM